MYNSIGLCDIIFCVKEKRRGNQEWTIQRHL